MNDQLKEKRFSVDIDRLLNSSGTEESSRAEDNRAEDTIAEANRAVDGMAGDDYTQLLDLAREVASVDYSADSKVQQGLLDKLLKQMAEKNPQGFAGSQDDELDEDELANVAGGLVLSGQEQGCALCGCKLGAADIRGETCPECGHSRGCHR